ncbi:MAG: hypothetical protein WCO88_09070 [Actinomycetota bacterium]
MSDDTHDADLDATEAANDTVCGDLDDAPDVDLEGDFDGDLDDAVAFDAGPADPVSSARRRHGAAGAIVAAGMLGLDQVLGRKPKQEAPIVVAANSDPVDIDRDGIEVVVEEGFSVVSKPLPRAEAEPTRRRSAGSSRRKRR